MKSKTCAVVMPAHNEAKSIRQLVLLTLDYVENVIVVDDGSTDGTAETIRDLPIELVVHETNKGKSAALISGFERAKTLKIESLITMDSDGQHKPEDLPKLIAAQKDDKTIVIAARTLNRDKTPTKNLRGNLIADFFVSWAINRIVIDSQSGLRLYPMSFIRKLKTKKADIPCFLMDSKLLLEAANRKYEFNYIPISAIYSQEISPSHYRPFFHTFPIIWMISWYIIRRFLVIPGLVKAIKYFSGSRSRHEFL